MGAKLPPTKKEAEAVYLGSTCVLQLSRNTVPLGSHSTTALTYTCASHPQSPHLFAKKTDSFSYYGYLALTMGCLPHKPQNLVCDMPQQAQISSCSPAVP